MKVMLDTHTLLWWLENPERLTTEAQEAISSFQNEVLVSAVVIWEIAIKESLGKLEVSPEFQKTVSECGFVELPISFQHARQVRLLPAHHRDPFDRMLIAQAIVEDAFLVTRDVHAKFYPVNLILA